MPMPGQSHKLYELDGAPIRFSDDPRAFPERLDPESGQWEPFHGLTRIAFEGKVSGGKLPQETGKTRDKAAHDVCRGRRRPAPAKPG